MVPAESMSFINPDGSLKSMAEIEQQSRELIEAAQRQAREASEAILALVGEGSSRDGAAKVTVGATGALQAVRLNDRVKSMTPPQIAASVMEAYGAATRHAAESVQAAAAERPRGDQVLAAIRRLVPQQEDAEGQSW